MVTTPIPKGRPPLIPIQDNARTIDSPLGSAATKPVAGFTPTKRDRDELQRRLPIKPLPRNSRCNYETATAPDDRDEQGNSQRKKAKGANSKKRVSFGGNSVKIITEHGDGRSTLSRSAIQVSPRIPSVDVPRTPPLSRRSPVLVSGINDDSDMDTLSPTRAPSRVSDSPSRFPLRSPSRNSARSPQPQRLSIAERARDRQSFGLFYDEDVTIVGRGIRIESGEEDTTQPLPPLGQSVIDDRESDPVDGDITFDLGYGYHDLMNQARYDEAQHFNVNLDTKSPARSSSVPEQRNLLRDYATFQDSTLNPRKDHSNAADSERDTAPEEKVTNHATQRSLSSTADERRTLEVEPRDHIYGDSINEDVALLKIPGGENDGDGLSENLIPSEKLRSDSGQTNSTSLHEAEKDITPELLPTASTDLFKDGSKPQETLQVSNVESPGLPPALGDIPDTPNQPAMEEYEGLLDSAMASSGLLSTESNVEAANNQDFSLDELLRRLDVRFDNPTRTAYRDVSIAPIDSIPPQFDPSSSEFALYECGKENFYLERLRMEKKRLKDEIASVLDSIKSLEEEIRVIRPPMVQMLTDYKDLSTRRGTDFQCVVRRLRKASAFQAKEKWVDSRKEWEGIICDQLEKCADVLENDNTTCQAHLTRTLDLCSKLAEADESEGLEKERLDPDRSRRLVIRDMSFIKGLREFLATQEFDKSGLLKKLAILEPKEVKLSRERDELKYVGNDSQAMKKRIAKKREEFSTIASVTGVLITEMSMNIISVTLCGLADLNFSLHDNRIINTTCKPVKLFGGAQKAKFQNLIDDSVKIFGSAVSVKGIKFVHEIPPMLRRFAYTLMKTQYFLEEACRYYMNHLGSLTSSTVTEVDGNAHVRVLVSGMFHSMSLRSHFDVVLSWTASSTESGENAHQELVVEEIKRTIGTLPDDDDIRTAVQKGVRSNLCSVCDSFQAVSDLL
ncbi:unnamed protein product [Agarophyton chilense]